MRNIHVIDHFGGCCVYVCVFVCVRSWVHVHASACGYILARVQYSTQQSVHKRTSLSFKASFVVPTDFTEDNIPIPHACVCACVCVCVCHTACGASSFSHPSALLLALPLPRWCFAPAHTRPFSLPVGRQQAPSSRGAFTRQTSAHKTSERTTNRFTYPWS